MKLKPTPVLPPLPPDEFHALRDSIAARGVQTPLLVAPDGSILDGNERFRVIEELKITRYPLRIVRVPPRERRAYAIRVNIERRHLSRADRRALIEAELRDDPARSDRRIAGILRCDNKTVGSARRRLFSREEIPQVKRVGRDGKSYGYSAASTEIPRQAREIGRLLESLGDRAPHGGSQVRKLRRLASESQRRDLLEDAPATSPEDIRIYHGDFRRIAGRIDPESVSLVVGDPPWNAEFRDLREDFCRHVVRILKPGGIAAIYSGHVHLAEWLDRLRGAGLLYRWTIAAINADGAGSIRANSMILSCWRPILLFQKPGARFKPPYVLQDLMITKIREKDSHPWQQPQEEAVSLVRSLTSPGDLVCDLTLGSGTVPAAVAKVGTGRRFVGCEIDADCVRLTRKRVAEALRDPSPTIPRVRA